MTGLVISLTTIPPRLPLIGPTLRDLLNQSAPVDEIRLYLPRRHRRFPLAAGMVPELPSGIRLILLDEDFGPATKVLPAARDLAGQDVELIFCDDDQAYDPEWAARFVQARKQRPNDALVQKGYHLEDRPEGTKYYPRRDADQLPRAGRVEKNLAYRLRRALSLGQWRSVPFTRDGYVDILEGYRGAMIRPEFLPPEAFVIPELLWTVDDPWLSGHLHRTGHAPWLVTGGPRPRPVAEADTTESLRNLVHEGHDRRAADTLAIEYFRRHYHLWPDARPPQHDTAALSVPALPHVA
ncbi:glycosyltransferase family 2 protein [Paracoccus sp. TK19116]|uniref:Glycosyltransferase family 2 protein n=1 Tax=Paracoccus albicereus TaxID=2922394 RepID=A0ABT1MQ11_9RHOB|nr:glycosyltransferase family 2 protein [Paracoccus albicereus]MCQ0970394.1 glycosyltransferase family 2 protein [Paracoccus albicereus]